MTFNFALAQDKHNKTWYKSRLFFVFLVFVGCRSKLDVETKQGDPLPEAAKAIAQPETVVKEQVKAEKATKTHDAQEIKDKVSAFGGRKYFQSRDTISFVIERSLVDGASGFSVLNVTGLSEDKEDQAPAIIENQKIPANLTDVNMQDFLLLEDGYYVKAKAPSTFVVNLLANHQKARKNLKYGKNKLKIVVLDEQNPRFSYIEIFVKDFMIMGSIHASFANKQQVIQDSTQKFQFEGWLNTGSPVSVRDSTGKTILTSGSVFNMIRSFD